jgi:hypothetical protein
LGDLGLVVSDVLERIEEEDRFEDDPYLKEGKVGNISRRCTYLEAKGLSVSSSSGHFNLYLHDQLSSIPWTL